MGLADVLQGDAGVEQPLDLAEGPDEAVVVADLRDEPAAVRERGELDRVAKEEAKLADKTDDVTKATKKVGPAMKSAARS